MSDLGEKVHQYLREESGATMMNWFVAGHQIDPDHWYFHESEGGRILGNLCHWTDFTYSMIDPEDRYPIKIVPSRSVKSDCDICVNYIFGDGSIAAITFSAMGHTFEGVREIFSAHKGSTLLFLKDFEYLTADVVDRRSKFRNWRRDHGHSKSICNSYELSLDSNSVGLRARYIWESAQLYLATKEALEKNEIMVVNGFSDYQRETSTS